VIYLPPNPMLMKRLTYLSCMFTCLFAFAMSSYAGGPLYVTISNTTNATCAGINNGTILATAGNGAGSYTYSWSPSGGTNALATNLAPGTYTVTVTDAAFATATATATIGEDSPLTLTTDSISNYFGYNISCFGGTNGWINTSAMGGQLTGYDSTTFNFTGAPQIFVVPAGITAVKIKTWGAQGGANWVNNVNYGGYSYGELTVTPGETLYVYVGGQPTTTIGGYNGGGNGEGAGKGGGGASDVRQGGTGYNQRVIVAGGGGGAGYWSSLHVVGGVGGGLTGGNGYRDPDYASNPGGQGGTQSGSGVGTCISFNNPAMTGGFGYGGSPSGCGCEGYGGGGGWYGGAGSGNCRGGGGGSGYIAGVTNGSVLSGINIGHGKVMIIYGSPESISYLWSQGSITDDVNNLGAGTYTCTATSASGCVATTTVSLTQPTPIAANFTSTAISCYGDSDGSVSTNTSGGIAGYTYLWANNASTSSSITNLAPGTYTLTITDTAGCMLTDSINLAEPTLIDVNFSSTNASCFGGADGSIAAIPSGGTPPYQYLWDNAATTSSISGLTPGVYVLVVTDTMGCVFSDSVTITSPADLVLSATSINESSGNDGSINLTVSGGNPPYAFSWSNSAVTEDINGLPGGSYTVEVIDSSGCTDTLTVIVGSSFGITDHLSNGMMIYPNPAHGIVHVAPTNGLTGEFLLSIMDISGRKVYTQVGIIEQQPIQINTVEWSSGTYIIQLHAGGLMYTQKLVIQ
jgi:hypothetical protein